MDAMIYIVSGLPRSGTSMMMKMLEAGGLPVLKDKKNPSTNDNPGGAYAYEPTKTIPKDASFLEKADGKVVKIVSYYLTCLPKEYHYKIIFMERDIDETLVSQQKMKMKFSKDTLLLEAAAKKGWLSHQPNIEVLLVDYNTLTTNPVQACKEVSEFIGIPLDCSKMGNVFDSKLYRNRVTK
jgi:hypothetical protein